MIRATARALRLPFVGSFGHAAADRSESSSILVRLETDDGLLGFGEGCPREYVTGESLAATLGQFDQLAAEIDEVPELRALSGWLDDLVDAAAPSLRCAIECAALDIIAKRAHSSVSDLLGATAERVRYSAVISNSSAESARNVAVTCVALGFADIKVKVDEDLEGNVARVAAVREVVGPDVAIRVDANMAWQNTPDAERQIRALESFGVWCVEQPLPRDHTSGLLELDATFPNRILLDESVVSDTDVENFVLAGFRGRVLLKVSKNGGPLSTLRMARYLDGAGLAVHLGTHVGESSLLSAAGRVVASTFEFATVEGSAGRHLMSRDVVAEPLEFGRGGWASARIGEGHGWQLDVIE